MNTSPNAPCTPRLRLLPGLGLAALLLLPATAAAQDSDGDSVPNASDAFPCDASRASVSYFPGQSTSALLAYEDQWPGHTDLDFNDVVVRVHYRLERNAAGNVVQLHGVFDPVAVGGDLSNGLGLVLPVLGTGVTVRRRVGGGTWQTVTLETDANATMLLSSNLRELYANAPGRINSRPNEARQNGQRLEVEVSFATPAAMSTAGAPFDVFIFRTGTPGHQVHLPNYFGTAAMNTTLFNSAQDRTVLGVRAFVHLSGIPAALNLLTSTRYPLEGVGIGSLFPNIAGFASSAGTQNTDFYAVNVISAQGHDVAALALPGVAAPSTSCVAGSSQTSPAASCQAILSTRAGLGLTSADGTYWINPSAPAGTATLAYCDMTTDGGGWTLWGNVTSAPFSYDGVRVSAPGVSSLTANAIGEKPAGTLLRIELVGSASSTFRANFRSSATLGAIVLPTDSVIPKWVADVFVAGASSNVSQTNASLTFNATRTGYFGGSLVWLESDNAAAGSSHSLTLGGQAYSSPPSPYDCVAATSQRLLWVMHENQPTSSGFNFKNTMNLHRHSGCNVVSTSANATALRLYYR
jgi:LruC domain-containing protein